MNYPEKIKTIKTQNEYTLKEKKSVFKAIASPILSINEAEEYLNALKKRYYDASHHCYAYKLTDGTLKSSDAGEPNGTAGKRIMNAIEHFELTNTLVVVIRYFGGVKLGTGPLGKAYYTAAHLSLKSAEKITKELYQRIKITTEFEQLSIVYNLLSDFDSQIEKTEYKSKTTINCLIKPSKLNDFGRKLKNESSGRIKYTPFDDYLYL